MRGKEIVVWQNLGHVAEKYYIEQQKRVAADYLECQHLIAAVEVVEF